MTLLLSDLHLPADPSPLRQGFLRFLAGPAQSASAVYLLGDLFEYWIGDDDGLEVYRDEIEALRHLTDRNVPVFMLHGNRDFLVGSRFAAASGVQLLKDPAVLELEGCPTLLSHGDRYCTDDRDYQRWRRVARNRALQALLLSLPRTWRQKIAKNLRGRSDRDKLWKPPQIMDVNATAIHDAFHRHAVTRLIHGHTHRPDEHSLTVDGRPCRRIVLADWLPGHMEYLRLDTSGLQRLTV